MSDDAFGMGCSLGRMNRRVLSIACSVLVGLAALACAATLRYPRLSNEEQGRFERCREPIAHSRCARVAPRRLDSCIRSMSEEYASHYIEPSRHRWLLEQGCTEAVVRSTNAGTFGAAQAASAACEAGLVRTDYTSGRCCWPAQFWDARRGVCAGEPSCPAGTSRNGDSCARD